MRARLLGASVLGHGLGALRHGVLGKLSGEEQADSGLDLAGRDGRLLVVLGELAGLSGNALEDVVDERVEDGHGLGRDASVGVDLLEHLEDVDGVRLLALLVRLLGTSGTGGGSLGLAGLLVTLLADLGAGSTSVTLYHPAANGSQDIFSYNKPTVLTTGSTWYISGTYFLA